MLCAVSTYRAKVRISLGAKAYALAHQALASLILPLPVITPHAPALRVPMPAGKRKHQENSLDLFSYIIIYALA